MPPKIPGNCIICGERLSEIDMRLHLQRCEARGVDPLLCLQRTPPGLPCTRCKVRGIMDAAEDPASPGHALAKQALSVARREHLGIKVVK